MPGIQLEFFLARVISPRPEWRDAAGVTASIRRNLRRVELFALKLRRALLLERRDAFLVVRRFAGRALRLRFAFQDCEQAHRLFVDPAHQMLRLHERRGRAERHLRRNFARLGDERVLRHASIYESDLSRFDAREQSSRVNQFERTMGPQARDEKRMAARIEYSADARERRADLRVVRHIDDVASQRQTESYSQARAMNGGKGRRGKRDDALDQRIESALDYRLGVFVARMGICQIAAGRERRALATNHQRARTLRGRALERAV